MALRSFSCAHSGTRRSPHARRPRSAAVSSPPASDAAVVITRVSSDAALREGCASLRVAVFYAADGDDTGASTESRLRAERGRDARLAALGMKVSSLAAVLPCGRVAGTLDMHVGDSLPGEPLEGLLPPLEPEREAPAEAGHAAGHAGNAAAQRWAPTSRGPVAGGAGAGGLSARASYRAPGAPAADAPSPAAAPSPPPRFPRSARPPRFVTPDGCGADVWRPPPADPPSCEVDAIAAAASALSAAGSPSGCASRGRRAYVFNVAVLPDARRKGVATRLLRAAAAAAKAQGVTSLYCHAEASNSGAVSLYTRAGWTAESEEPEWLAERLGRPRRVLLRRDCAEINE